MKRNDLIKLLEENFTEDEDVKFIYTDDQGVEMCEVDRWTSSRCTASVSSWEHSGIPSSITELKHPIMTFKTTSVKRLV